MTKPAQEQLWGAERITSDWLNAAIRNYKTLNSENLESDVNATTQGAELEIVSVEPVGTGQVASALRIVAREIDNPSIISYYVAKTPSEDEKTRQGAFEGGIYLREIRFYEELAERSLISVPEVFFSDRFRFDFRLW